MALDIDGIATAIAARYAAGQLTAPSGYATIRSSTANPPGAIGPTPAVVVSSDRGDFDHGSANGSRLGEQAWWVRFYFDQTSDLERTEPALRKWLAVLIYQHLAGITLGSLVVVTRLVSWRIGILAYGGMEYAGIELSVHTATSEAWAASA
jgi:hypothetical protein